jgi:hypothetical protein
MRTLLGVFALGLAVGCCKPQPVPVPCPEPPAVVTPEMDFPKLAPEASLRDVVVALTKDWMRWEGHAKQLEAYINAYRKTEPATKAEIKGGVR